MAVSRTPGSRPDITLPHRGTQEIEISGEQLPHLQVCISNASRDFSAGQIRSYVAWGLEHAKLMTIQSSGWLQRFSTAATIEVSDYIRQLQTTAAPRETESKELDFETYEREASEKARKIAIKLEKDVLDTAYTYLADYKKHITHLSKLCAEEIKIIDSSSPLNPEQKSVRHQLALLQEDIDAKDITIIRDKWYEKHVDDQKQKKDTKSKSNPEASPPFNSPTPTERPSAVEDIPTKSKEEIDQAIKDAMEQKNAPRLVVVTAWETAASRKDEELLQEIKRIEEELAKPNDEPARLTFCKEFNFARESATTLRMRGDLKKREPEELETLLKHALREETDITKKENFADFSLENLSNETTKNAAIEYLMTSRTSVSKHLYSIHGKASKALIIEEFAYMRLQQKKARKFSGEVKHFSAPVFNPAYPISKSEGWMIFDAADASLKVSDPDYFLWYRYVDISPIDLEYGKGIFSRVIEPLDRRLQELIKPSDQLFSPRSGNHAEELSQLVKKKNVHDKTTHKAIQALSPKSARKMYHHVRRYSESSICQESTNSARYIKKELAARLVRLSSEDKKATSSPPASASSASHMKRTLSGSLSFTANSGGKTFADLPPPAVSKDVSLALRNTMPRHPPRAREKTGNDVKQQQASTLSSGPR